MATKGSKRGRSESRSRSRSRGSAGRGYRASAKKEKGRTLPKVPQQKTQQAPAQAGSSNAPELQAAPADLVRAASGENSEGVMSRVRINEAPLRSLPVQDVVSQVSRAISEMDAEATWEADYSASRPGDEAVSTGPIRSRVDFLGEKGEGTEEANGTAGASREEKTLMDEQARLEQVVEDAEIESFFNNIDTYPGRGRRLIGRLPLTGWLVQHGPASGGYLIECEYWGRSEYAFIGPVSGRIRRVTVTRTNNAIGGVNEMRTPTSEELERFWTE